MAFGFDTHFRDPDLPLHFVSPEDFQAALRHCADPDLRQLLYLCRYTGALYEDIGYLGWDQVEWDPPRIWLYGQPNRPVNFLPRVGRLLWWRWCHRHSEYHVFPDPDGYPWDPGIPDSRWDLVRQQAEARGEDVGWWFRLLDLRTTFLVTAVARDVSPKVLEAILGLENPCSVTGAMRYNALRAVEAALRPARRPPTASVASPAGWKDPASGRSVTLGDLERAPRRNGGQHHGPEGAGA